MLRNAYRLLDDKGNVLPVWLRQAGYVTAHVGKFLNVFHRGGDAAAVAPGWSEWHTLLWKFEENYYGYDLSVNGKRVHHGFRFRDYSPQVFERTTKRLIQRYVPLRPRRVAGGRPHRRTGVSPDRPARRAPPDRVHLS